jgi:hypothetical protein
MVKFQSPAGNTPRGFFFAFDGGFSITPRIPWPGWALSLTAALKSEYLIL